MKLLFGGFNTGRGKGFMINIKERTNSIKKDFGKLELVDKDIFFISFNTRDN